MKENMDKPVHPKIVLWRPMYDQLGHRMFEQAGATIAVVDTSDAEALKAELAGAQALWVRTPERVTAEIMDAAPSLITISTSGFGTDNIDLPAATERGILVVNHLGFGRTPVAEHSLMLLLAVMKQLIWGDRGARDGSAWSTRSNLNFLELEGRTIGLLGLGYIGSELARKLKLGFGCRVIAYDPHVNARMAAAADVELAEELEEMLGQVDALCICAELNDETRNIISDNAFNALPKGSFVVNAARGQIIDLDALTRALDSGQIAGAGLDVVYPEPLPQDHPLLRHQKVIFTPHTAGITVETSAKLTQSAIDQVMTVLGGGEPRFAVNAQAWEVSASRRPAIELSS
ncbi:D-3-phosphoglycerate dehydrogenase [bacterium MnTg02]|nr:D-3-phosphoglycerate dehydrogenase [bacterium MnTg02]